MCEQEKVYTWYTYGTMLSVIFHHLLLLNYHDILSNHRERFCDAYTCLCSLDKAVYP